MKHSIGIVTGSLRRDSFNRKLATALVKLAPAQLQFRHLQIGGLPLYNQDDDGDPHESVRRLKSEILAADGIIFVTPEYNRSIPGVLKNALDHASRPYGQSAWAGKPAGILGISIGQVGTACAQQHLRSILGYLDMPTLGQPELYLQVRDDLFDADGSIAAEGARKVVQSWLQRYAQWVAQHAPSGAANDARQAAR